MSHIQLASFLIILIVIAHSVFAITVTNNDLKDIVIDTNTSLYKLVSYITSPKKKRSTQAVEPIKDPSMSHIQLASFLIILIVIAHSVFAQLSDACVTNFGKFGKCVGVEQCPAAIKLIAQRKHPQLCKFDKTHPIVCCEVVKNNYSKPQRGEIARTAKQKCFEYITISTPTTTTTTTTTMAPGGTFIPLKIPIILSGVNANPLEFPHMVLLGYGGEDNIQWKCGGSIISDKFILTAAHCVYSQLGAVTYIGVGVHQISLIGFQRFKVKTLYQHPDYNPPHKYNDIALIEIDGQINFTPLGIRPACLQIEKEMADDVFIATGWGAVENGGDNSDVLQKVNLMFLSQPVGEPWKMAEITAMSCKKLI
ncbi:Trypsin [Popillia japonica]|uniref:Trypsin n=1 Tax=Popillia japonica TaxID=7064 RepID=A0AAW1LQG1_POPJA